MFATNFLYTGVAILVGAGLLMGWWFLWAPLLVWYSIYKNGWWLVLLAIIIDGYYGAFYLVPYQSLLASAVVVVSEYVRPYIFTT